jgi:hypothetical protein
MSIYTAMITSAASGSEFPLKGFPRTLVRQPGVLAMTTVIHMPNSSRPR